jgi:hypothetical protein
MRPPADAVGTEERTVVDESPSTRRSAVLTAWQPRVGDRVRVELTDDRYMRACAEDPRIRRDSRWIGRVVRVEPEETGRLHRYLVMFECPNSCRMRSGVCVELPGRHVVAEDLQPIA